MIAWKRSKGLMKFGGVIRNKSPCIRDPESYLPPGSFEGAVGSN